MSWTMCLVLLNLFAALFLQDAQAVTVAIIDTGADATHSAFKGKLWINPGETGKDAQGRDKATNGIDDDGNGFVDDVNGWSFADDSKNFIDNHGHGTHIAGIIRGIAPDAKLMIIKYFDPKAKGSDNLANLIRALNYAVRMGADIINYSGGGFSASKDEKRAILEASKKGILVVAAAGNEASNSDLHPFYPADYKLPNILSVTAHDPRFRVLSSSNYGVQSVDIAAPGLKVVSAMPRGQWGEMSGTSQATAAATGAAAQLLSQRPDWLGDPARVIEHLRVSSRFEESLIGKTASAGALDLQRNLSLMDRGRSFSGLKIQTNEGFDQARRPAARLK